MGIPLMAPLVGMVEDCLHELLEPWLNPLDGVDLGWGDEDLMD